MMRVCPGCGYRLFHAEACPIDAARWRVEAPWWQPIAVASAAGGLALLLGSAVVLTFALLGRS